MCRPLSLVGFILQGPVDRTVTLVSPFVLRDLWLCLLKAV